MTDIGGSD